MSLFNRNKKFWIIKPDDTKAEKKAIEKTRRITDQELLKEIYSTASTSKIRITALENIEDQEYLYDVFINTDVNTLSLIDDPSVVCRIADNPEIPMDLRRTAAYRCRCGQLYREIETRAAMDTVCLFNGEGWWDSFKSEILPILARINSEEALREIAHQAKSRAVAEYAVQRINDSQTLSEIAKDIHAAQKYYKETWACLKRCLFQAYISLWAEREFSP